MKEIQAYVRPGPLAQIIERLEAEGARDLAVARVDAIGALAATEDDCLRRGNKYREQYADMAKVEIVCADTEVERFVNVLKQASVNGAHNDGRIFVLNVEAAINLGDDAGIWVRPDDPTAVCRPPSTQGKDVMKSFGINIQEWFKVAFNVPVVNRRATVAGERRHMNRIRRTHRRANGSLHPNCVYLEFVNRRASRVAIAGSFNDWRPTATPMIPMGGGWWVKGLVLPPGRHEYRFVVDECELPDPNAPETTRSPDGRVNSVLVVPEKTGT